MALKLKRKKRGDVPTLIRSKKSVRIKLLTPLLGTAPKSPEVFADYIATKGPDVETIEEEVATAEATAEAQKDEAAAAETRGWTGFHKVGGTGKNAGKLFIYDYVVKGFMKSALEILQANQVLGKVSAYKKWIDGLVFVFPRQIVLGVDKPDGYLERPLRTMGAKGPRVTLCRSDLIDEGRQLEFTIELLENSKGITWPVLEACLSYGELVGLGQWRGSGGYGRFKVLLVT